MAQTFSYRRLEVVTGSPAADDFKERWPALFTEAGIKEEFRRITTIPLEQTFVFNLDSCTPKLLSVLEKKGGAIGAKLRPILDKQRQDQTVEMKRGEVIRGLMLYLGEKEEELFLDCQLYSTTTGQQHKYRRNSKKDGCPSFAWASSFTALSDYSVQNVNIAVFKEMYHITPIQNSTD